MEENINESRTPHHTNIEYCYRVGIDAKTGKEVAVQFELVPDNISQVSDAELIATTERRMKELKDNFRNSNDPRLDAIAGKLNTGEGSSHEKALEKIKNTIRKLGHVDFKGSEMFVRKIFTREGSSLNTVNLVGIMSSVVDSTLKALGLSEKEFEKGYADPRFSSIFLSKVNPSLAEKYTVNEKCIPKNDPQYLSTRLIWDRELHRKLRYTNAVRPKPVDIRGARGDHPFDMSDFLKNNYVNPYKKNPKLEFFIDPDIDGGIDLSDIYQESAIDADNFSHQYRGVGLYSPMDIFILNFSSYLNEGVIQFTYTDKLFENPDCEDIFEELEYFAHFKEPRKRVDLMNEMLLNTVKKECGILDADTFDEGSHGLLKFDYRLGWDANTGHQIKVVYSLKDINVTDVGDFYYNYAGKKAGATHDSHLDYTRNNIAKKGNTDHQSTGQKVLAIVDMVTKKRLSEVDLLNPFCRYIDTHAMSQPPENLKAANAYTASNPDSKVHLKVGEVDNTKTYKTTTWTKGNTTDRNGEDFRFQQIASSEELKDGRGWKIHNIIPKRFKLVGQNDGGFVFKQNPTREEALKELEVRHEDTKRMISYISELIAKGNNDPRAKNYLEWLKKTNDNIQKDYSIIKSGSYDVSMMKKYRENVEYTESYIESFMDSTPPAHEIEYTEGGLINMDTEYIFEAAKEPDNDPEYNTNMTPAAAKRTLGTATASVIQNKKANQYTADIYGNIITKNLLGTWAKGYRKLSITLDPKLKGSVFEFKIPNMTLDFVSRFVDGREPINGLLHRIPEIKIRMSEGAFKTMQNRDDAFNFFRAAVKYYDTGVIRYSERIMTEIMKLPTEMKRLISSTKLSGIVTLPIQMLFSFDGVDMSSTTTFNISKEDINTVTKFIRSIYSNYASPEKEKQKIISDLQNVVYHLKESCELDENKVAVTAITEGVSEWYSGKMNTQLDKYRAEFEYENVDAEAMINAHHELKMLYESTKMKKLKKIPRDLVAYITIETESIRDANDKMMIASYCLSKLEIVEWYIELLEVGSKKYIVPHSLPYLQSLRTQLLQCYNNIMKVKIVRPNERPLIDMKYPHGYEG